MTRTVAREIAIQISFSLSVNEENLIEDTLETFFNKDYYESLAQEDELYTDYPNKKQREYISLIVTGTQQHRHELDDIIARYSKGWKLSRISRIATAILRTALYEVLYLDDVPDSVAINEAVELAKGYEEPETVSFINGILGSYMRAERGSEPLEVTEEQLAAEAAFEKDDTAEDGQ